MLPLLIVASMLNHPASWGRNRDRVGDAWSINANSSLEWGSKPYQPIGIHLDSSPASLRAAKRAGILDVAVDMAQPSDAWAATIRNLENEGFRYLLDISAVPPASVGYAIHPEVYRFPSITATRTFNLTLPQATDALAVLAESRDGSIVWTKHIEAKQGVLHFSVSDEEGLDYILLVYPRMHSLETLDYWEGADSWRDHLLAALRSAGPHPGLRGIVDPFGKVPLIRRQPSFIPDSNLFRSELARHLESEYRSARSALIAWSMSSSYISSSANEQNTEKANSAGFQSLARLIPLWEGHRGVSAMWDPKTNQVLDCDKSHSRAWADIRYVLLAAKAERTTDLIAALKSITAVPILQTWNGWGSIDRAGPNHVDGVAFRTLGVSLDSIEQGGGPAASSAYRMSRPCWLVAEDVSLGNHEKSTEARQVVANLTALGARAIFFSATTAGQIATCASLIRTLSMPGATDRPNVLFYPVAAANPANTQLLPGNVWWLPAPYPGNRLDIGDGYSCYRISTPEGDRFVLWSDATKMVVIKATKSDRLKASLPDGSPILMKSVRGGYRLQVSGIPVVIDTNGEIPIPEDALQQTVTGYARVVAIQTAVTGSAPSEALLFQAAHEGLQRNPGGNYFEMRSLYLKDSSPWRTYTWIPADRPVGGNYSDVLSEVGTSAGKALALIPMTTQPQHFEVAYDVPVTQSESFTLWIGARIPSGCENDVKAFVGGRELSIRSEPTSIYGDGFAWYRAGAVSLRSGDQRLRITVDSSSGEEIDLDAMLFMPGTVPPRAPLLPSVAEYLIGAPKTVKKKPGRLSLP